ncbi:hypothetical protein SAMN04487934_11831 [Eubacterium ruminantium]|nr:hypothetical protein SAMN04487934_11631 [Eubacterium ruminantium]SEG36742.1 hypothetical protein SAMN04487934_11831 [Eubacterium ruminantium]
MDKYVLNKKTGTLHVYGECCHSKVNRKDPQFVFFKTYDDATKSEGIHKKDCRICFKDR